MGKRFYFPVGYELSTAQLKRFDWADMQNRSLNDPAYGGFDPKFNWRNYVELKFDDKNLQQEVSKTLDQFGRTPEGQHTIRQAFAMQNYRIRSGQTDYARDQEGKLYITDQTNALQTLFSPDINGISVYRPEIAKTSLLGKDGYYYHMSLAATLYHELCHAKDGLSAKSEDRWFNEVKGDEVRRDNATIAKAIDPKAARRPIVEKNSSLDEYPAIIETNAYMKKYYGEQPRALSHNSSRENTWFNETFGFTWAQPNLPKGIDYNDIPNLPVPNNKPKAPPAKSARN